VGDPTEVKAFIDAGAEVQYCDADGYDALIDAVHGRDVLHDTRLIDFLELLIANGVSLRGKSVYGESAVRVLSRLGRFDAVRMLLDAGADPGDVAFTPLIEAVAFGSLEDVERAIARGAELEERDHWERTAWIVAVQIGDIGKAERLRAAGAQVNARGRCGKPAFFYGILNCQTEMLRWLLGIGIDITQKDDFGTTALATAVESDSVEIARLLLNAGADVNEGAEFRTALHGACTRDVALLLLDAGADPLELGNQARRAIVGYPPEPDETLLNVSASEFEQGRSRRFGVSNPERMEVRFWKGMILSGISAYEGKALCVGESASGAGDGPVWCAQRYGQSLTFLPDGRVVQIAGEHEDSYDPDFCIYNDVFVHDGAGDVTIFGYPEAVFPPTDFHTATLIGEQIYLIGSLGYHGTRRYGFTPVYRMDTRTFRMEPLVTTGTSPGWIYEHRATPIGADGILVTGGTVVEVVHGDEVHSENTTGFILDIGRLEWRVR
jgi:ankyrin repeat protein